MRIRFYNLFIVLALTFFSKKIHGQSLTPSPISVFTLYTDSLKSLRGVPFTLQKDTYVKSLAFFCRQEWKIEKSLKVPLRFRLGSLNQCNFLEGKK
jgi:hypothetical protein